MLGEPAQLALSGRIDTTVVRRVGTLLHAAVRSGIRAVLVDLQRVDHAPADLFDTLSDVEQALTDAGGWLLHKSDEARSVRDPDPPDPT